MCKLQYYQTWRGYAELWTGEMDGILEQLTDWGAIMWPKGKDPNEVGDCPTRDEIVR
jgi:hypothetical protein